MKPDEIVKALDNVMKGQKVFSQSVLNYIENRKLQPAKLVATPIIITKREQSILKLLSNGFDNIQIAEKLGISVNTVYLYCNKIRKKTGTTSRTDLIKYAIINNK